MTSGAGHLQISLGVEDKSGSRLRVLQVLPKKCLAPCRREDGA